MKFTQSPSALLALVVTVSAATSVSTRDTTYDYIVAGGGTAGIVAAERLANAGHSVLLLERGGPSFYSTGLRKTMAWNDTVTLYDVPGMAYFTGVDPDLQYCKDLSIAAGCLLGGSTMLNAMMYVKPRAADFEAWPKEWYWNNGISAAAEAFYEKQPGTILASADGKRYNDGAFEVMSKFLESNGWSEMNALADVDAKHQQYSHPAWSIVNGLRDSPARSVLPHAEALPNFHLELNTKVLRAVRNGAQITGVEVEHQNSTREIIKLSKGGSLVLAAGTHSTPRVLFNSGIGPFKQIETVASGTTNIQLPPKTQWIPLPVGENMRDHPIVGVEFSTKEDGLALPSTAWMDPSQEDIDLFAHASGLLAQSGQRLNFWTSVECSDGITRYIQGTVNAPKNNTIAAKVYLTHGLTSVGSLGIKPDGVTEITKSPLLNTDGDREAIRTFIDSLLDATRKPGSILSVPANATVEELMKSAGSGSHYIGTTKMGAKNDGSSVVDPDTRVWGTKNLFVVDGSMHPEVPTGNTQAPIMVAAAYAAERIMNVDVGKAPCKNRV